MQVARGIKDRKMQRALMRFFKPEYYFTVREALIEALTGWGQENDRERSREAGCDGHFVKPVDFADLQRVLAEVAE